MKNKSFNLQFSERLRELMVKRGYASRSASSGVSPAALCKTLGCFSETALRHLNGKSVPSPENILKISEWLQVEPGFLLFGEQGSQCSAEDKNKIKLDKDLFNYALKKITPIIKDSKSHEQVVEFFISILSDLSHMQIEVAQLKQVFDVAIKSSLFFGKEVIPVNCDYGKSRTKPKATS